MKLSKEEQHHILERRALEALENAPKPPEELVAEWKATADAIPATRDNGMKNAVNIAIQAAAWGYMTAKTEVSHQCESGSLVGNSR